MTDPVANSSPAPTPAPIPPLSAPSQGTGSAARDAQLRLKRAAAVLDLQIAAADLKVDNQRWKARRWMAWVSLAAILLFGAAMMFVVPKDKIDLLSDVYNAIVMACTTIIGAYVGSSVLAFIATNRSKTTTVGAPTATSETTDQNPFANLGGVGRGKLSDLIDIDADGLQERPPGGDSSSSPSCDPDKQQ